MAQGAMFAGIMRSLDAPMAVVSASVDGERAGCLVGFHAQSSIEPFRYVVWLSKANHTYRVASRSTHLGVHFLATDQRSLAERFGTRSGDDGDKFDGLAPVWGPEQVPLVPGCGHRLLGRRIALLDEGGDHVCVVVEPTDVRFDGPFQPLRLSDVSDLRPGHAANDRPWPPTERAGHPPGS